VPERRPRFDLAERLEKPVGDRQRESAEQHSAGIDRSINRLVVKQSVGHAVFESTPHAAS
jgi:hypothetical protein